MFKKIVFPTDFSIYSQKVLECIPDFKIAGIEEAVLIHVLSPLKTARWTTINEALLKKIVVEARTKLEEMATKISARYGIRTNYKIETGFVHQEINNITEQENASLIIMGSQGHSFNNDSLLGSTTEHVLRYAKTPLLIERLQFLEDKEIYDFTCKARFKKILFPCDFSDCSLAATQMIKEFKELGTAEVVVAHIQDTRKLFPHLKHKIEEFNRLDTERLNNIAQQMRSVGYKTKTVLREGIPFIEINKIALQEDVCMIVMGSYGRSALKEVSIGTVSEAIARHNVCPVMIVPGNWKPASTPKKIDQLTKL